jgi:nicotinic acid mononucleotide adenylyltransferase
MHLKAFDIAAKFLTTFAVDCLVGFVSPSSDSYLRGKLGDDAIPFRDRLHLCTLSCATHNADPAALHLEVDPWEGSQPRFIDFPSVHARLSRLIAAEFPDSGLRVLYVCGADHFVKCRLARWANCVAIARPPFVLRAKSVPERNIYVCTVPPEDAPDLFADLSSTELRRRLAEGEPLGDLVYPGVEDYLREIGYRPTD